MQQSAIPEVPRLTIFRNQSYPELNGTIKSPISAEPAVDALDKETYFATLEMLSTVEQRYLKRFKDRVIIDARDLFPMLGTLKNGFRVELAQRMMDYSESNGVAADFSYKFLQGMLKYFKTAEKVQLVQAMLKKDLTLDKQLFIEEVLMSSRSLSELINVVRDSHLHVVHGLKHRQIVECIATAKIGHTFIGKEKPKKISKRASLERINERLDKIKDYLKRQENSLKIHKNYYHTTTYQNYKKAISRSLYYLNKCRSGYREIFERRNLVNDMIDMLGFISDYGIALCIPKLKKNTSFNDWSAWSSKEMKNMKQIFSYFLPGKLLLTPGLCLIYRAGSDSKYDGQTFSNGPIEISDHALDDDNNEAIYVGQESFTVTMRHELAHRFAWGKEGGKQKYDKVGTITGPFDPRSLFPEFLDLSGWRVILPQRYKLLPKKHAVLVDKKEYLLGEDVELDGRKCVLSYSDVEKALFSRDVRACFGYMRKSPDMTPDEDKAETSTDYHLAWESTIPRAPEKMLFEERFFRYFDRDVKFQKLLAKALKLKFPDAITVNELLLSPKPPILEELLIQAEENEATNESPPLIVFEQPLSLEGLFLYDI